MAACGVKGSFVHKCIWLPFIHENEIFCYRIFCPKSSIGRKYCLENMKQGEVRKLLTCIKLSSICTRMPMMGWPVQKVWGLIPLGGSEFFPCPTLTEKTSLSRTCLVWLVWERGKPSVFCHFQHEWSGLFTVKLRKLWTLEIFMGCYVFPRRRPIRHKITELQTAIAIKLWFCG